MSFGAESVCPQSASEKCSYLEELSCKEGSLKENWFYFHQNQDNHPTNSLSTKQSTHQIHTSPIQRERCCGGLCERLYRSPDRSHPLPFPCPLLQSLHCRKPLGSHAASVNWQGISWSQPGTAGPDLTWLQQPPFYEGCLHNFSLGGQPCNADNDFS